MQLKPEPDAKWPGMWRVRWPDGLSDMVNLTRAKDAIACFLETFERQGRGRQSHRNGQGRDRLPNSNRREIY